MKPLSWFRCGTSSPFHQSLGLDLSALRGDKGNKFRAEMEAALTVEEGLDLDLEPGGRFQSREFEDDRRGRRESGD
jgi:hypothetical protein